MSSLLCNAACCDCVFYLSLVRLFRSVCVRTVAQKDSSVFVLVKEEAVQACANGDASHLLQQV